MNRAATRRLADLLAATEPVGNDQRGRPSLAHGWKQNAFAYCLRHSVLIALEAERSGHPAATRVGRLQIGAHGGEQRAFIVGFHDRALMAVPVQKYFSRKRRKAVAGSVALQKFAEKKRLVAQPVGAWIGGKKIVQFVAKHRGAARLEHHDGDAGVDFAAKSAQDALEVFHGAAEHPEIVERPAAAKMLSRNRHVKARMAKHLDGRLRRFRVEIIVERVCPQYDFASPAGRRIRRAIFVTVFGVRKALSPAPLLETAGGESGNFPRGSEPQGVSQKAG